VAPARPVGLAAVMFPMVTPRWNLSESIVDLAVGPYVGRLIPTGHRRRRRESLASPIHLGLSRIRRHRAARRERAPATRRRRPARGASRISPSTFGKLCLLPWSRLQPAAPRTHCLPTCVCNAIGRRDVPGPLAAGRRDLPVNAGLCSAPSLPGLPSGNGVVQELEFHGIKFAAAVLAPARAVRPPTVGVERRTHSGACALPGMDPAKPCGWR
jgi:hypothetical protein